MLLHTQPIDENGTDLYAVRDLIASDDTILEKEPLERVASIGQLNAFKHEGFWQCMDTIRDRDFLQSIWESGNAPWLKK